MVLDYLRRQGHAGDITILKQHLAASAPPMSAPLLSAHHLRAPPKWAQIDWWHTGFIVSMGNGATRAVFALLASLPKSAAHACAFTFSPTTAALCRAGISSMGPRRVTNVHRRHN